MNIGILGSGVVGRTLGAGCIATGHKVTIGSREGGHEKLEAWAEAQGPTACAGTFAEAARFGEIVILATLGVANDSAIALAGPEQFAGKILIDATNPLDFSSGVPALAVGFNDSGGEQVQRKLPQARVVKAFNSVGNSVMFRPGVQGGPPDMFICGNDDDAKAAVTALLSDFGWNTIDIGGIEGSRYLEPMCMPWILHGIRSDSWHHAWKFLTP